MSEITNLQYPGKIVPKSTIFGRINSLQIECSINNKKNHKIAPSCDSYWPKLSHVLYYMHCMYSNAFYPLYSMHLDFCILFYVTCSWIFVYVSCPMHMSLCTMFCASLNFIQCISMLHLITCISFYAFHFLHPYLLVSFYSSLSMHFILFNTVTLLLKLIGDRPTNWRPLSHFHKCAPASQRCGLYTLSGN